MTTMAPPKSSRLAAPLVASAGLHLAAIALMATRAVPPAMPPLYEVNLIAAPAGPRAVGSALPSPAETPAPATPAPAPKASPASTSKAAPVRPSPATKAIPARTPAAGAPTPVKRPVAAPVAAPVAPTAETPVTKASPSGATAAGGPTGDKGTDVATVRTEGTAFPFPGYLQNIVRQIALNFRPRAAGALRCDVAFLIHRDGTVSNVRFVTRSGSYAFDLEAQGAIEAVARSRAFGALPTGFADDVLPVTFAFDPRLVH